LGMIMFPFTARVMVDKMYEYSDDDLQV
jgi:hypothetical protein